jgi:hypothetical protein
MQQLEDELARLGEENDKLKTRIAQLDAIYAAEGGDAKLRKAGLVAQTAGEIVAGLNDVLSNLRINVMAAEGEFDQFANHIPRASFELIREALRTAPATWSLRASYADCARSGAGLSRVSGGGAAPGRLGRHAPAHKPGARATAPTARIGVARRSRALPARAKRRAAPGPGLRGGAQQASARLPRKLRGSRGSEAKRAPPEEKKRRALGQGLRGGTPRHARLGARATAPTARIAG